MDVNAERMSERPRWEQSSPVNRARVGWRRATPKHVESRQSNGLDGGSTPPRSTILSPAATQGGANPVSPGVSGRWRIGSWGVNVTGYPISRDICRSQNCGTGRWRSRLRLDAGTESTPHVLPFEPGRIHRSAASVGRLRGVAQPGSALALGARRRRFKSSRPDHSLPPGRTHP